MPGILRSAGSVDHAIGLLSASKMTYGITIASIGDASFITISAEEFERIKDAKIKLMAVLEIEEKFDLFMENYAEYERDVLCISQKQMLRGDGTWTTAMDDLLLLNRRLVNIVTAGRLYRDQVKHDISTMYGHESVAANDVETAFRREYDGVLGYRVIEALRNHIQHEALPIRNLHYGPERVSVGGRELVRFTLTPELDTAALRSSGFKRAVLTEIEQDQVSPNVTTFLRSFVGGLSRVHSDIRRLTESDLQKWELQIQRVLLLGREQLFARVGVAAVARDECGNHPEVIEVFEEFVQRLGALRRRYLNVGSLNEWFLSSETT